MFERYTEKARRVIFFARYEASEDGSPLIEVEHLLAGLFRESKGLLDGYLRDQQMAELISALQSLREKRRHPSKISTAVDLPLSDAAKRVLAFSAEEAESLDDLHVGTEHLLLGLLREEQSAPSLLTKSGISIDAVRSHVRAVSASQSEGLAGARRLSAQIAESAADEFAEGCLKIVEKGGKQLAVIGLTATVIVPRIGEYLQLSVDGHLQRYRVVDITYRYAIYTPNSRNVANHLSAVKVLVEPKQETTKPPVIPDGT